MMMIDLIYKNWCVLFPPSLTVKNFDFFLENVGGWVKGKYDIENRNFKNLDLKGGKNKERVVQFPP